MDIYMCKKRMIYSRRQVHLNKRLQKRFDLQGDRLEYPSDEEGKERHPTNGRDGRVRLLACSRIEYSARCFKRAE